MAHQALIKAMAVMLGLPANAGALGGRGGTLGRTRDAQEQAGTVDFPEEARGPQRCWGAEGFRSVRS